MRFAYRFGPLAAIGAALAVLIGLISASGAGQNADAFAIDLDTAGNTATTLGDRTECREVAAGSSVTIDVTATNIPASTAMIAFAYTMTYDPAAISVTAADVNFLLASAPGSSTLAAGDETALPDTDGTFEATGADTGPASAAESGSGVLERVTLAIDAGAAPGGYALTLVAGESAHQDNQNESHAPDTLFGARLAVGVTCDSLPSPTAAPSNKQGDVDCSGGANPVSAVDALKVLRFVASLSVTQNDPCVDIGAGGPPVQGDVDCSAGANPVSAVDALKILRFVASLSVTQNEPCVDIGA